MQWCIKPPPIEMSNKKFKQNYNSEHEDNEFQVNFFLIVKHIWISDQWKFLYFETLMQDMLLRVSSIAA